MPGTTALIKRLRVLIISRLLIGACLLFYVQFVFPIESLLFYSIIAFISALSVFYVIWIVSKKKLGLLAAVQIVLDVIIESALIYYTGGVDSLFATIYVLSILSAGLVLSPSASFFIAGLSTFCFVQTILLVYFQWLPSKIAFLKPFVLSRRDYIYLFYASYVHITVFFLVALLTYYFSKKIQRLEQQVKEQERLVFLGEVASNIAHEIRNPLSSISTAVELISRELRNQFNERQQKLMNAVVEESLRVNRIFNRILNFARVPNLQTEYIRLESFLDSLFLLMCHQQAYKPNVSLNALYRGKDIYVKADPEQVKEACMNLLANAYEAMPDGGTLTVDTFKETDYVLITISDTGTGIDPKMAPSLFTPFRTNKTDGTGLGLAQANKIITQHGGRINIESKRTKGTRVEIFLPV